MSDELWPWRIVESSSFAHAFSRGHVGATFASPLRAACYWGDRECWAMSPQLEHAGTPASARFAFAVLGVVGVVVAMAIAALSAAAFEALLSMMPGCS